MNFRTINNIKSDDIFRSGSIMFFAIIGAGAFFYIFHIFIGRMLGAASYGEFGALFSLSYYLQFILFRALNVTVTRSISKFKAQNIPKKIHLFHSKMLIYLTAIGTIVFVIFSLLSGLIANFLHIDSIILVLWIGIIFFICWILPANLGTLQGLQRFKNLALMNVLPAVLKLIIGIGLVLIGFGLYGAIGGLVLGIFINFIISFYLLRDIIKWRAIKNSLGFGLINKTNSESNPDSIHTSTLNINSEIKEAFKFSIPVFFMVGCIAIPTNIDTILVKHFFSASDTGLFTAVTVFGKMILAIPVAITTVMYPKIVEAHIKNDNTRSLLNRSMIYTGVPIGLAATLFYIMPKFLLGLFYGEEYLGGEVLLKYYGIFVFIFSLTIILLYNSLALNRKRFVYFFVLISILELGLIWFYNSSLILIIQIFIVISILLLGVGFIENYIIKGFKKQS